jgi:DNA-binding NtrC family response regulator
MALVLIIDDNPDIGKALEVSLALHGIDTCYAADQKQGLDYVKSSTVDLVLQDMNFSRDTTSGREGKELFHQLRALDPDLPIILLTAWTDLETAVELVRAGAADYLGKPWDEDKLLSAVNNLLELRKVQTRHQRIVDESKSSDHDLADSFDLQGAVFTSEAMFNVLSLATQVADADVPVLITGPNGAGKDIIAKIVQANSGRSEEAFVTINVGALPKDLMEAELFGAEAGAFTGSNKTRIGRFEAADGGTLFLDEIGNLSQEGQMKLLRILQTGEFERLGSSTTKKVSVRVISATNTNLVDAIAAGEFREDLYYRLNLIEINVPSLAARPDDILPLAHHFLNTGLSLTAGAEQALLKHQWPGNVRELQNIIQRAEILCKDGKISPDLLGLTESQTAPAVGDLDRRTLEQSLEQHQGNVSKAARQLGISRQAMYRRMEKLGVKSED